ncbi:DUF6086 family protein [Streptomyces sp. NBC_00467]|uniref:DUF6086 family protein n=1 Tax=Streptomyces sp. NBC_00467 TaxID=2975752 RepID=UPI002E19F06F
MSKLRGDRGRSSFIDVLAPQTEIAAAEAGRDLADHLGVAGLAAAPDPPRAELKLPSGIGQGRYWGDPDTLEVARAVYEEFARELVTWHCRTGHSVILALSEGFVATAVALARRAGIDVKMPEPEAVRESGGVRHDMQIPGDPRTTSADVATALDARHDRSTKGWPAEPVRGVSCAIPPTPGTSSAAGPDQ